MIGRQRLPCSWRLQQLLDEASALAGFPVLRGLSFSEVGQSALENNARNATLSVKDPDHHKGYSINRALQTIDLYWGGYLYEVDCEPFESPAHLCEVLHHICKKGWVGTSGERIGHFIHSVYGLKGWDVYNPNGLIAKRGTSADEERGKLTPQLRYAVLKRDGFRCRACGAGPENGAVLHLDHIKAIAKGGYTTIGNLQTLCAMCNLGKGRS